MSKIEEDLEDETINTDQSKCQCWKMVDGFPAFVKAMQCGTDFCIRYLGKDIWRGKDQED
jgi:hypothetical protein